MTGAQVATQARELYPTLKVLFTTGTPAMPSFTKGAWTKVSS